MPAPSLLHDVLRHQLEQLNDDADARGRQRASSPVSEDEMVDVFSPFASPPRSVNITRASSPTRASRSRGLLFSPQAPTTTLSAKIAQAASNRDPLKLLPDKVRPFIFCQLDAADLAACSLVCRRWNRSQTVNHAWYQLFRRATYQGSDLPVGRWTKRESKKDWRTEYMKAMRIKRKEEAGAPLFTFSRPRTPMGSRTPIGNNGASRAGSDGYQTPREIKEEQWRAEEEANESPGKVEMREWYKERGGKRIRGKNKAGMSGGMRDRTAAWDDDYE